MFYHDDVSISLLEPPPNYSAVESLVTFSWQVTPIPWKYELWMQNENQTVKAIELTGQSFTSLDLTDERYLSYGKWWIRAYYTLRYIDSEKWDYATINPSSVLGWVSVSETADQVINQVVKDQVGNLYIGGYYTQSKDFGNGLRELQGSRDLFVYKLNAQGNFLWDYTILAGGEGNEEVTALSVDTNQQVFLAGFYEGDAVDFSGGSRINKGERDAFIVKLDAQGHYLWDWTLDGGGEANENITDLTTNTHGSCFVTGYSNSTTIQMDSHIVYNRGLDDLFVFKLTTKGLQSWLYQTKGGGEGQDQPAQVTVAEDGSCRVLVNTQSAEIDFGGGIRITTGMEDMLIVSLTDRGIYEWEYGIRYGGNRREHGSAMTVDGNGNTYVTGFFTSPSVDFGGGSRLNQGEKDLFLLKLDPLGNYQWDFLNQSGGEEDDFGTFITLAEPDAVVVTGYNYNDTVDFGNGTQQSVEDYFMLKVSFNAHLIWYYDELSEMVQAGQGIYDCH